MGTKVRIAAAAVLALAVGAAGFFIGSSYDDGRDARFATDVAGMAGVQSVGLSDAEIAQVSFSRSVTVDEVLAVRDRLEQHDEDPGIDVAGVYGGLRELDAVAATMIAVAKVDLAPATVRVREVGEGVWVEARLRDDATPADGVPVVLRILRSFLTEGTPEGLDVVGAYTPGDQLDLVGVYPEALASSLQATVESLAAVGRTAPTGKVRCDADGCAVAPFKADDKV